MENTASLFKRLDPMTLKGKAHPISPFVCVAQQGSDMWETHKQMRLVGRAQLQNSVSHHCDAYEEGHNGPLMAVSRTIVGWEYAMYYTASCGLVGTR